MHHYVYRIECGRLFYIGSRSCAFKPCLDIKYNGSGNWCMFVLPLLQFKKVIIKELETRAEADYFEFLLLKKFVGVTFCMNRKKSHRGKKKTGELI